MNFVIFALLQQPGPEPTISLRSSCTGTPRKQEQRNLEQRNLGTGTRTKEAGSQRDGEPELAWPVGSRAWGYHEARVMQQPCCRDIELEKQQQQQQLSQRLLFWTSLQGLQSGHSSHKPLGYFQGRRKWSPKERVPSLATHFKVKDHQIQRKASRRTVRDIGPCSKHVFLLCCSDIRGLTDPGETVPPRPSWFLEMVNLPSSALFLWKNNQSRAHLKTPSKNWRGWNCHIKNI